MNRLLEIVLQVAALTVLACAGLVVVAVKEWRLTALVLGIVLVPMLLAGCAGHHGQRHHDDMAYYVLHVIDAVQTSQAGNDPCIEETGVVYRAALGAQPDTSQVIAFSVAAAWLHHTVTVGLVDRGAPDWMIWAWRGVSYTTKAGALRQNQYYMTDVYNDPAIVHGAWCG